MHGYMYLMVYKLTKTQLRKSLLCFIKFNDRRTCAMLKLQGLKKVLLISWAFSCCRTANNAECVEVKCSASNCEIEEIDVTDYAYQKSFDRHDKDVSSNMAVSSTTKKDTGPDPSKPQLGKGRLIHSGPLLPSNVVIQSLGDQDRSSVRYTSPPF